MGKEFAAYKNEILKIVLNDRRENFEGKYTFESMATKLRATVEFTGDPEKDISNLELSITAFVNELNKSWL